MPFTIDFLDEGRVLEWEVTADGAVSTARDDYTPRFYVTSREPDADIDLTVLQSLYDRHSDVVATEIVTRRPRFRCDEKSVLAVDVEHIDRVGPLIRQAHHLSEYPVGNLACFNFCRLSPRPQGATQAGGRVAQQDGDTAVRCPEQTTKSRPA